MSDPRPVLVRDPRFRAHAPAGGGHPECPERLDAIDAALRPLLGGVRELAPRAASDEEILRVHDREHLAGLRAVAGRSARLDPDTYSAPDSWDVARLAAGSLIDVARAVARGEAPSGFAAIRPPGHHAERSRAMGFCLLNNVAIAAEALRADGVERVCLLDWDVHHGNGTQHSFESDRDRLFVSLHQFPHYPGTGALSEQGHGAGLGSTVNLPLPAGCGDAEYAEALRAVVLPVLEAFRPELILVSAGFDAHLADPLASMQVSTEGFAHMTAAVRELADTVCDGRLVLSLEGGYDLDALGASAAAALGELIRPEVQTASPTAATRPGWDRVVTEIREAHARHWPSLAPVTRAAVPGDP